MRERFRVVVDVSLPIYLIMGKKKYSLNLNVYRNLHYRTLNNLKHQFKLVVRDLVKPIIKKTKMKTTSNSLNGYLIIYKVYKGDKRRFDIANICSVVDKFFLDALVELGYLPDDNANVVKAVVYTAGSIDKDNPRVEAKVVEFDSKSCNIHECLGYYLSDSQVDGERIEE